MARIITLLTDFGTKDEFVAVMKGVILGIAPDCRIVDISHDVPPQDVPAARFLLASAAPWFPEGSIHVVVVDPGVGSSRRILAVRTVRGIYMAPDNGVLTLLLRRESPLEIVSVESPEYHLPTVSSTFHGRDIFAPAAAHLAAGVSMSALGPTVDSVVRSECSQPRIQEGQIIGDVIYVDRFGNCITNISPADIVSIAEPVFECESHSFGGIVRTYSDVPCGRPLALIGSTGLVEISIRDGNASHSLEIGVGCKITCSSAS